MNIFQDNQNYFNPFINQEPTRQKQPKLFEPDEAFMLGNLFKDLYMSYKGFSNYCLQPMNQRQKALLDVQINAFVAHEINLYLDMHPNNQRMVELYTEFANKAKEATKAFEEQFGPLEVADSINETPFQWVQGPWPWEYQN
ncbi:MAG: spore coat protein CotJB [Erysipelotrichales bacterium]|nr:spore coat protein CotJB [Erysipelotrichales bacterium]